MEDFQEKIKQAFKAHMFMQDRDYHTVNELLYILEHDVRFNKEDFNISIKTIDNNWWSIPCLKAFVDVKTRGIWFNDNEVEFEIEEFDKEKFNCITIYQINKQ